MGRFCHFFTEEGIREFAETGICADYPREYTRPLTLKERRLILDRIAQSIENGEGEIGFINEKSLKLTKRLNAFASGGCGLSLILYDERLGYRFLLIRENSLCRSFMEYIGSMEENGDVHSREKNIAMIRKYANSLPEQE